MIRLDDNGRSSRPSSSRAVTKFQVVFNDISDVIGMIGSASSQQRAIFLKIRKLHFFVATPLAFPASCPLTYAHTSSMTVMGRHRQVCLWNLK